ncbi:MAG: LysR family transcriptional regulator [Gammaproteobacteria bacterium]|nr:LysR family transcriptional regulator [Gammaproteobacteria bacterium]
MNPNTLKQLAIVVKQGSISRACEQLYITQPTLSRAIQALEQRVGGPVLQRTRYGVVPTEIGARLAQIGEKILADSEHSEEVIRQWHSGYQSEFSIGIDPLWELATHREMTEFLLGETDSVFHVRTASASALIRLLEEEALDFALAPAHLTVPQGALEREIVFRDRAGVFAGKTSSLLCQSAPIAQSKLDGQPWIIAGAAAGFLDEQTPVHRPSAAKIAFTGALTSVLHLLKTQNYLSRLPARLSLLTGELEVNQLIELAVAEAPRRDIALWWRQADQEKPRFSTVRNRLLEFAKGLDVRASEFGLLI